MDTRHHTRIDLSIQRRAYRPSYTGCRTIHSTSELDLPIFAPLPIFARPSALSSFGLEKTYHLFVWKTLTAIVMGSPNTTRRPVSQYIHVGEPALSRLSNALRNDGGFLKSMRSSHRAYISRTSIVRSEPAFHMAKNRGMKQIPATCTNIWTSISATACVQTLRSCPEPQASVSLLSPPFPAQPALRHCNAKQEWRF